MTQNESWLDDLLGETTTVPHTPTIAPIPPTATPTASSYEQDRYERRLLRKLGSPKAPISDAPLPTLSGHETPPADTTTHPPYVGPSALRKQLTSQLKATKKAERKAKVLASKALRVLNPPKPAGYIEPTLSVDERSPEPLKALMDGQKLIQETEDGFPSAKGKTLPLDIKTLDERERKFVGMVFNGIPADEAVDRAGYPPRPDFAMRLIAKPHIKQALDWMQQEYLRSIGATLTNAVTQMTHIAFLDPRKVVNMATGKPIPLHELDSATAAAIEGVEITETDFNGVSKITKTKYKFNSKLKALQQLGDHLGLFNQVQKVELSGVNGGPIQMEMSQTEIARRMLFVLRQQGRETVDVTPSSE